MEKESSLSHYNSMNVLSMHALIGAYKPEGYEWVDQLCQVLTDNVNYAYDYITTHFSGRRAVQTGRKPTCSSWTAPDGARNMERHWTSWKPPGSRQELSGRTAGLFHGPCSIRMNSGPSPQPCQRGYGPAG